MHDYDVISDGEIDLSDIEFVPKGYPISRDFSEKKPSKSPKSPKPPIQLQENQITPDYMNRMVHKEKTKIIKKPKKDKQITIAPKIPGQQSARPGPSVTRQEIVPKKEIPSTLREEIEEDTINKRRLLLLIQFYLLEFPEKLSTFKKIKFENKSVDELEKLKKEMDFTISNSSTVEAGTQMIMGTIQTLEVLSIYCGINCQGLSNRLCNDKQTIDDIKHLCLKHMHLVSAEPEARLLYKILTNMVLLHNINPSSEQIEKVTDEIHTINSKYKDI